MRWGNGAKLQHLLCTKDDLSLQLVGIRHSKDMAPGVEANWEHGQDVAGGIPGYVPCLQLCRLFLSSHLACSARDRIRELLFCMPEELPNLYPVLPHPIQCTEHPGTVATGLGTHKEKKV